MADDEAEIMKERRKLIARARAAIRLLSEVETMDGGIEGDKHLTHQEQLIFALKKYHAAHCQETDPFKSIRDDLELIEHFQHLENKRRNNRDPASQLSPQEIADLRKLREASEKASGRMDAIFQDPWRLEELLAKNRSAVETDREIAKTREQRKAAQAAMDAEQAAERAKTFAGIVAAIPPDVLAVARAQGNDLEAKFKSVIKRAEATNAQDSDPNAAFREFAESLQRELAPYKIKQDTFRHDEIRDAMNAIVRQTPTKGCSR